MFFKFDGAFSQALGSISNAVTGLGTGRDKTQSVDLIYPLAFTQYECDALYRTSRICQRAIDLLPEDSAMTPPIWKFDGESAIASEDVYSYLSTIPCIPRGIEPEGTLFTAITEAAILGRKYGDGYIVLNIADGGNWDEPVNLKTIRSIVSCAVFDKHTLSPVDPRRSPLYRVTLAAENGEFDNGLLIHKSRVLTLPGKKLKGEAFFANNGFNDSILQAMLYELVNYQQAVGAGAHMLADHSIFKYKMSGLARKVELDDENGITSRLRLMMQGLSVVKGLVLDADLEDAEFISKNYGGVKDILEHLRDCLASAVDMPRIKIFGSPATGALSEAGLSERYEWRDSVQRYRMNILKPVLETLTKYCFSAKDSPTKGNLIDGWSIDWKPLFESTWQEEVDLRDKISVTDERYVRMGVLTLNEVRESRFATSEFGFEVTLDSSYDPDEAGDMDEDDSENNQSTSPNDA